MISCSAGRGVHGIYRVQVEPLPVAEATLVPGNPIAPIALSPDIDE